MGRITNGSFDFSEVRKLDDYGINRSVKLSLSFTFDEGEDYDKILDGVQQIAKHRVQVALGLTKAETAPPATKKPQSATAEDQADEAVEPPKPKKRGPKPKLELMPVDEVEDEPVGDLEPAEEVEADDIADDLADLEGEEAFPEITDADLTKAIALRKEKLGEDGGVKIRKLILKFAPKIPAIPQDKRAVFLESLKALK